MDSNTGLISNLANNQLGTRIEWRCFQKCKVSKCVFNAWCTVSQEATGWGIPPEWICETSQWDPRTGNWTTWGEEIPKVTVRGVLARQQAWEDIGPN